MRIATQRLALVILAGAALGPFAACHNAHAEGPAPRAMTPSIDLEIEDRAPDKSTHTARFTLSMIDGRAQLKAHDGDAHYAVDLHTPGPATQPNFSLSLKRGGGSGDIDLSSAIPQHGGGRMVIAKIDRADGRFTSVTAQVR